MIYNRSYALRLTCIASLYAVSACMIFAPSAVRAQVLEIGATGDVAVYDRPAVFDGDKVTLIEPATSAHSSPRLGGIALQGVFDRAGRTVGINPDLLSAIAHRESGSRADVVSRRGAIGVMQLMPATARELGVDPRDPEANVFGGARYLRYLIDRFNGDLSLGLAAYNAGPGAVQRYGGLPPFAETRAYVNAVLRDLARRTLIPTS